MIIQVLYFTVESFLSSLHNLFKIINEDNNTINEVIKNILLLIRNS